MKENTKKIRIVDVDTACDLLGCVRSTIYNYYLARNIIKQTPRYGRKAYLFLDDVERVLNDKIADLVSRKNMKLSNADMNKYKLVPEEFKNTYQEVTSKNN